MIVRKYDNEEMAEDLLHELFEYRHGFENTTQLGWLLNYQVYSKPNNLLFTRLYFVDEEGKNFMVDIPFYPYFLIETGDNYTVTEYLEKRYSFQIHHITAVEIKNPEEVNHLHKKPKEMLKVFLRTEKSAKYLIKEIKDILAELKEREKEILENFEEENTDSKFLIKKMHEYDIPIEIQAAMYHDINCGCWYEVIGDGDDCRVKRNGEKVSFPPLKIFAFDIETYKDPLKFCDAKKDEIMMVSIMTGDGGYLITNRKYVSKDIDDFSYSPKKDIYGYFKVYNEKNEKSLLERFIREIQRERPHIISTFNGDSFDIKYVEDRMKTHLLSFEAQTGFFEERETHSSPFMIHLDCYRWVKRDSYLPMSCQGLKAVTRAKLGYEPEEIDPEEMVQAAIDNPVKMAAYSVSDAVATFHLYEKFVHRHIFSMCKIIPLTPVSILSKGSGGLCESLLISEANKYQIVIRPIQENKNLQFFRKQLVENLTYVGGHVESLKAGIFRSDFMHSFEIDREKLFKITEEFDEIFSEFRYNSEYELTKKKVQAQIDSLLSAGSECSMKGKIFHLDVEAMYPNIILTNRLQPDAMINEGFCPRCDPSYGCSRRMEWVSRAEVYPINESELKMILTQLSKEVFYSYEDGEERRVAFDELPIGRKETILKSKIENFSHKIYKKNKVTEERKEETIVCQRAIPFYVETVRKFKEQRLEYKRLFKKYNLIFEANPTKENEEIRLLYNSQQIAYKCVLNSFYGYVMRKGSRWFSLEMAAVTCYTGSEIIKETRKYIGGIGIPLELDTDGIWAVIPEEFPSEVFFGDKKVSLLSSAVNYFVCRRFKNDQYQELLEDGTYQRKTENLISLEVDGPYKTMVIPASLEKNVLLKKRYAVFDSNNRIVELKGFELKRRGELGFVKELQKELFDSFTEGRTLEESYKLLGSIGDRWIDIIKNEGKDLTDERIIELFSHYKMMSKTIKDYVNKKSNISTTALRLAEILGSEILIGKLKCEFLVMKFPLNAAVSDRVVPIEVFKHVDRDKYLKRWFGLSGDRQEYTLTTIIDWDYYYNRLIQILQRMIVIPAYLQNVPNPIPRISYLEWMNSSRKLWIKRKDAENQVDELKNIKFCLAGDENVKTVVPLASGCNIQSMEVIDFVVRYKNGWIDHFNKDSSNVYFISVNKETCEVESTYYDGTVDRETQLDLLLLEVNEVKYFNDFQSRPMAVSGQSDKNTYYEVRKRPDELKTFLDNFFAHHFSVKRHFLPQQSLDIPLQTKTTCIVGNSDYSILSSTVINGKIVFCLTSIENDQVSEMICSRNVNPATLSSVFIIYPEKDFRVSDMKNRNILSTKMFIPVKIKETFSLGMKNEDANKILHSRILALFVLVRDVSNLLEFPLGNLLQSIEPGDHSTFDVSKFLDSLFVKLLWADDIIPVKFSQDTNDVLSYRDFCVSYNKPFSKPGYHSCFSAQLEIPNCLLLAILESDSLSVIKRLDFITIRKMARLLILKTSSNARLSTLVTQFSRWFYKSSLFISSQLRSIVYALHHKYICNLVVKLKENQVEIFGVAKETLFVDTGRSTREGCLAYIDYISKTLESVHGCEMLSIGVVRIFEKISFINSSTYFFPNPDNTFTVISDSIAIPNDFFIEYFSDLETGNKIYSNEFIYSIVDKINGYFRNIQTVNNAIGSSLAQKKDKILSIKALLKILGFRRDVHGLATNCYKLLHTSEFAKHSQLYSPPLSIFCSVCLMENYIGGKCAKCFACFSKLSIEEECIKYLNHCWCLQLQDDKYCSICAKNQELRLQKYCHCGGKFAKKDYFDEVKRICDFVDTGKFNSQARLMFDYFEKEFQ